jgi:hypothetical protein
MLNAPIVQDRRLCVLKKILRKELTLTVSGLIEDDVDKNPYLERRVTE